MKAIIPVAGAGTKLRPLTYTQPKPLIPVAGKPIIAYIVDDLISAGITKFVFVLGYLGEKIKLFLDAKYPTISKEYVYQEPREGTAHAIWESAHLINPNEPLIIQFGDTILDLNINQFLNTHGSNIGVKRTDNPSAFGVAEINDVQIVDRITEKPKIPKSNWALVGLYKIQEVVPFLKSLNYIVEQDIRTLGELHLTDALMHMIEQGISFRAFEVDHWWDCGQKDKLLKTNALLLDKFYMDNEKQPERHNNIIIPPVSIGKNCKITDSIIGPHVSIGDHTIIHKSIFWNSIVGNYSELHEAVMKDSVLGNDVLVKGFSQSLNIGDNADIDLSH